MMNKELCKAARAAIDEARDDYADDKIECGEIPDRATELLQHRLDCPGQRVHTMCFWYDDNESDLDRALGDTIEFCMNHSITDYAITTDGGNLDFVFVVYLTEI